MKAERARIAIVGALQMAAVAVLALALTGHHWLDPRLQPRWLVLVDRSQSMPRAETNTAAAAVAETTQAVGAGMQVVDFAGRPGPIGANSPSDSPGTLDPGATNIEAAISAALDEHARQPLGGIVLVSDGWQNVGDARTALLEARSAGLPVLWRSLGGTPPSLRIGDVLAPERVTAGRPLRITAQLRDERRQADRGAVRIEVAARSPDGHTIKAESLANSSGLATIEIPVIRKGPLVLDVGATDAISGTSLDVRNMAAVVDVVETAKILYVRGSGATRPLAESLRMGGWPLDDLRASQAASRIDALAGYRGVVLDDIAIADADQRFWDGLIASVRDHGMRLLVLAGEHSFALGGYTGSTLETILPVRAAPSALDDAAAVLFVVDKSGSMGEAPGGAHRFQRARQAVVEAAQDLGDKDTLGVMLFDVVPRTLLPLTPAPQGKEALARDWPVTPQGGTRITPAIEHAMNQLEQQTGRRIMVLVTDGFIDDAPFEELRDRLLRARIELVVIAVGGDVGLGALKKLVGDGSGTLLRVNEASELPLALRQALQQQRSRVERGTIEVVTTGPLPFSFAHHDRWPPVAAYSVTRLRPDSSAALSARNGDPIIAARGEGDGQVIAVTSGLGSWTPKWLGWSGWPLLAGGLADWAGGGANRGTLGLWIQDGPRGLSIDADVPAGRANESVTMSVHRPGDGEAQRLNPEQVAPGRWHIDVPATRAGIYEVQVATPYSSSRRLHLRRNQAEQSGLGISPDLDLWRTEGLIADWSEEAVARRVAVNEPARPVDRSLIGAALILFIASVIIDRLRRRR